MNEKTWWLLVESKKAPFSSLAALAFFKEQWDWWSGEMMKALLDEM